MQEKSKFCKEPFQNVEIHPDGVVYACCPNFSNYYKIGNIFENSFEEVWNSDKIQELRRRILNNDYSLCDVNGCAFCKQQDFPLDYVQTEDCSVVMQKSPFVVKLCYDYECNIACKMCRDNVKKLADEELSKFNSKIDTFFIPLLKETGLLKVNAHGDAFGSRHTRELISKVAKTYPSLKFDFQTNGLLCNEQVFKSLNLTSDRIQVMRISIHAATLETYSKIVTGGENLFPILLKNLEYISKLRERINFEFYIHFVVSAVNYKEIPAFIKLAEKYGARPYFWELFEVQYSYKPTDDDFIHRKNHPLHNDLLKVLNNPIVKEYKKNFSPVLYDMIND